VKLAYNGSVSAPFKIILEWDPESDLWVSSVPDVGDISTYGDTLETAIAQTREAILGYLETAAEQRVALSDESALLKAIEGRPTTV
jgi:predicted RNase H-like HicB family nuclease